MPLQVLLILPPHRGAEGYFWAVRYTHSKAQCQAVLFFLYTHVLVNYFTVWIQMSYYIGRAKSHIYSINHLLERKYLIKS